MKNTSRQRLSHPFHFRELSFIQLDLFDPRLSLDHPGTKDRFFSFHNRPNRNLRDKVDFDSVLDLFKVVFLRFLRFLIDNIRKLPFQDSARRKAFDYRSTCARDDMSHDIIQILNAQMVIFKC